MNGMVPRKLLFCAALAGVVWATQSGCRRNEPATSDESGFEEYELVRLSESDLGARDPIASWESPRMLEVKNEWHTLHESLPRPTKDNFHERQKKLRGLLMTRLSRQDMATLAVTCESLPVDEREWDEFSHCMVEVMLDVFIAMNDRENLVMLLSLRCPSHFELMDIEEYLVCRAKRLEDPVLIFGEAYSKCRDPQVRQVIGKAVRRGFKGFGIRGNNDTEFVEKAMKWYGHEKNQLVVNPDYGLNQGMDGYYKRPLFTWKSPGATGRSTVQRGVRKPVSPRQPMSLRETTNSLGMKMVLIPAGEFLMGEPDDEERHQNNDTPQHPVRITKAFWLGAYEVTQAEYEQMMGHHRSFFCDSGEGRAGNLDGTRFPADQVSWYQAADFCNRLSEEEGFPAYYRLTPRKRGDTWERWKDVDVIGGAGYRLPTEAEWEYACRAGTTTAYSFGESISPNQANFGDVRGAPKKVGSYRANAFGLYDMHGNLAEWCQDEYQRRYYEDCPIDDPPGPSSDGPARAVSRHRVVARGGFWSGRAVESRSAHRMDEFPWVQLIFVGFRVARDDTGNCSRKVCEVPPETLLPRSRSTPVR